MNALSLTPDNGFPQSFCWVQQRQLGNDFCGVNFLTKLHSLLHVHNMFTSCSPFQLCCQELSTPS